MILPPAEPLPFPHFVADDLWPRELLEDVRAEFPPASDPRWHWFGNALERKAQGGPPCWGPATITLIRDRLSAPSFREQLAVTFGIDDELIVGTEGGGMHFIPPGGYLGVHADFNQARGLYRRVNVLVYLNDGWRAEWGGQLELWDDAGPVVSVDPVMNRTVAFLTSDTSFHGHPHPTTGPEPRCSIAAYYFTEQPPAEVSAAHSTIFHPHQPGRA